MGVSFKIAIFLISLFIINQSKIYINDDYKTVTSDNSDFKFINNSDNYEYWECRYNSTSLKLIKESNQIVAQVGNKKYSRYIKKIASKTGFMQSCGPAFCSYYIIAVKKDKTVVIINNYGAFKNFIGEIDNVEEAKLSIRNNG